MRNRVKPETLGNARKLRVEPTVFEKLLWRELRQLNRKGHHFRRQVPFRGYILDFVEHGARLLIELDGVHHFDPDQARHDLRREGILEKEGYRLMHFENGEVQWIGSLMSAICQELERRKTRPPSRNAARSDLPTRGR
jgi:very-short-patch-repair endonuclease